jgi:hypothetical protein
VWGPRAQKNLAENGSVLDASLCIGTNEDKERKTDNPLMLDKLRAHLVRGPISDGALVRDPLLRSNTTSPQIFTKVSILTRVLEVNIGKTSITPFENEKGSPINCYINSCSTNLPCLLVYSFPLLHVIKWGPRLMFNAVTQE